MATATAMTQMLTLLVVANGAPILARLTLRQHLARPIDGGRLWGDQRPIFGPSKTFRGVAAALGATSCAAYVLGLPISVGALVAALSMVGDLLSSFIKRRLGLPSSSMALGLDQIPESLFPTLAAAQNLTLSGKEIAATVLLFAIIELLLSRVLFRIGVRERPY